MQETFGSFSNVSRFNPKHFCICSHNRDSLSLFGHTRKLSRLCIQLRHMSPMTDTWRAAELQQKQWLFLLSRLTIIPSTLSKKN